MMWLPIVVVALPTMCLLWFMGQAVRNERLAVKQRLIEAYRQDLGGIVQGLGRRWQQLSERTGSGLDYSPAGAFKALVLGQPGRGRDLELPAVRTVIVCGPDGRVLYPSLPGPNQVEPGRTSALLRAWEAEFVAKDLVLAAGLYRDSALTHTDQAICIVAAIGAVRCMHRLGRYQEAVGLIQAVLDPLDEDLRASRHAANLRVRALEIMAGASMPDLGRHLASTLDWALDYNELDLASSTRAFVLSRVIELASETEAAGPGEGDLALAKRLLEAELAAMEILEEEGVSASGVLGQSVWPVGMVRPVGRGRLVAWAVPGGQWRCLLVMDQGAMISLVRDLVESELPEAVGLRLIDQAGRSDGPVDPDVARLGTVPLGPSWPQWQMDLYLRPDLPLALIARRQQALYLGAGTLVVVISLIAGLTGAQAIRRQARLNRLKNDFIATVTHELKTPLASMRLLVDTLLEGRVTDQEKAREYLQIVARENLRLSGLIDNFLTFSRMERDRLSFNKAPVDPAIIAQDALDAVLAKWGRSDCQICTEIESGLPAVFADHEAIVTVLVNLLDNACKYSPHPKQIRLQLAREAACVRISVSDNGIGIPRRAMRRIFDRFYQVDRSLSRRHGGCGLGLAIVKFIVTAHDGRIDVHSRVGQGSIFTVRLPVWRPC